MNAEWTRFLAELAQAADDLPDLRPVMVLGLAPAGSVEKPTTIWDERIPDPLRRQLLQVLGKGKLGPRQRVVDGAIVDVVNIEEAPG